MSKKNLFILVLFSLCLFSCVAQVHNVDASSFGFWYGLWHGFISLITLIISIFNSKVCIYQIINVGIFYNVGFSLGCALFYGLIGIIIGYKIAEYRIGQMLKIVSDAMSSSKSNNKNS